MSFEPFWKLLTLLLPLPHLLEAVPVGDVVYENGSVGIAVVDGAERVEPLLAGRVPDGERHAAAADRQLLGQEASLRKRQSM